ncbi:MAG: tetratricopeptide repeat protein [Sumerlaeia bacterium]
MRFSVFFVSCVASFASVAVGQQEALSPVVERVEGSQMNDGVEGKAGDGVLALSEADLAVAEALELPGDDSLGIGVRLSLAEALITRFPERGELWAVLGELRLEAGDQDAEALLAFERAVAKDSTLWSSWHWIGIIRKRGGDYDGAIEAFKTSIANGAPEFRELNEWAYCLAQKGNLNEAFAIWQLAIEKSPEKGFLYSNALKAATMLRSWEVGAGLFDKALVAGEFDERSVLIWTDGLVSAKKRDEAIAAYQKAILMFPQNAKFRFYYGATLRELKRDDEAETEFRQAITLADGAQDLQTKNTAQKALFALRQPKKLDDLIEVEELLQREDLHKPKYQKKLQEARQQMTDILADYPDFWEPMLMRGVVNRRLAALDLAEQDFKQVLILAPDQPNATLNLGLIEQDRQNFVPAMGYARKALQIAPRDPLVVTNGIFILINGGACDEATVETRRATDVLPKEILDAIYSALQGGCPEPGQ